MCLASPVFYESLSIILSDYGDHQDLNVVVNWPTKAFAEVAQGSNLNETNDELDGVVHGLNPRSVNSR